VVLPGSCPVRSGGDADAAAQEFGLAMPAGIVTHAGVAGLTLGGGLGWLSRRWRLTSDGLIAVRMLLADGSLIRAAAEENEDLFWAVRGGGGNFGIVTGFEFQPHSLGTSVLAGPVLFRAEQAHDVLSFYKDFIAGAPDAPVDVRRHGAAALGLLLEIALRSPADRRGHRGLVERSWVKSSPASYTLLFHMGEAIAELPEENRPPADGALHAMNINAAWPEGGPATPTSPGAGTTSPRWSHMPLAACM
jgi:hypothetical protein